MSVQDAVAAMKARLPVQRMGGDMATDIPAKPEIPAVLASKKAAQSAAMAEGSARFTWDPCKACGCTEYYTCNAGCCDCNNRRAVESNKRRRSMKRLERKTQQKVSDYFFNGDPCKKCDSTLKYKNGGQCVPCARNRAIVRKHEQRKRDGMW